MPITEPFNLIIPCGGTGKRFNAQIPKQFYKINNLTILEHTLKKFNELPVKKCILPVASQYVDEVKKYLKNLSYPVDIVLGGPSRAASVKNALQICLNVNYTLIHDAVRPFVSHKLILSVLSRLVSAKAVIPVVPITDTVKQINDNHVVKTLDRSRLVSVQTPQGFHTTLLKELYKSKDIDHFTDDASLFEAHNQRVEIVDGEPENKKITQFSDSYYFKFWLDHVQKNS